MKKKDNKKIQFIKRVLTRIFGEKYEQNKEFVQNIIEFYSYQKEKEDGVIDYNKIDIKRLIVLAYFYYYRFLELNQVKEANELYSVIKDQKYIKRGEGLIVIGNENQKVRLINSDKIIFKQSDKDLEKNYSKDEKLLLRGYCRILPFRNLLNCFDCSYYEKKILESFFNVKEETTLEKLYMDLIKFVKRS